MSRTAPGQRIRLLSMQADPDPIPAGAVGTVLAVRNPGTDYEQIHIDWDNGRRLMLAPEDRWTVIADEIDLAAETMTDDQLDDLYGGDV